MNRGMGSGIDGKIEELMARVRELQAELEKDLEEKRGRFRYHLEDRRVRFEQDILALHKRLRTGSLRYVLAPLLFLLTVPIIYAAVLPLLLLDLTVTVYQAVCFPVYHIPKVERAPYFAFDRELLSYLTGSSGSIAPIAATPTA